MTNERKLFISLVIVWIVTIIVAILICRKSSVMEIENLDTNEPAIFYVIEHQVFTDKIAMTPKAPPKYLFAEFDASLANRILKLDSGGSEKFTIIDGPFIRKGDAR